MGAADCVFDTAGATEPIFAANGCGAGDPVATEATFAATGFGSSAVGFAVGFGSSAVGFAVFAVCVDAAVEPGWRAMWRVRRCIGSSGSDAAVVFSAGAVLSSAWDDDSVSPADGFGVSGFEAFGADDPSEVDVPDADVSSA